MTEPPEWPQDSDWPRRGSERDPRPGPHAGRDRVAAAGRAPAGPALAGDQDRAEPDPDQRVDGPAGLAATGYPSIHVAGTNGKTSVARMIDALITALQRRTGRTTSPHLQSAVERISIDAQADQPGAVRGDLPRDRAVRADGRRAVAGGRRPRDEQVRGADRDGVRRVRGCARRRRRGRGGHGRTLGCHQRDQRSGSGHHPDLPSTTSNTWATILAGIAGEKAGIITKAPEGAPDTVAVIARQAPEAMEVLLAQTVAADAAVAREDSEFAVLGRQVAIGGQVLQLQGLGGVYSDVYLPLHGEHQAHNAVLALAAVEAFFGAGAQRQLDVEAVRAGFAAVASPGRLERMRSAPTVFIDAAHNPGRRGRAGADAGRRIRLPLSRRGAQRAGRQGRRRHPRRAGAGVRRRRGDPQRVAAGARCRVAGLGGARAVRARPGDHRRKPARRHRRRDRAGG